jgi:hypothetical protein
MAILMTKGRFGSIPIRYHCHSEMTLHKKPCFLGAGFTIF